MNRVVHKFEWEVPKSGFRWVRGEAARKSRPTQMPGAPGRGAGRKPPEPNWFLVRNPAAGTELEVRCYDSLAVEPALYRTFAETEPTREGIAKFADRYGMLGVGEEVIVSQDPETSNRLAEPAIGESERTWHRQIAAMRDLVHLWDLCERGDTAGLSGHIHWSAPGDEVGYRSQPAEAAGDSSWKSSHELYEVIARDDGQPGPSEPEPDGGWFGRLTPGDVLLPALVHLQRRINEKLVARNSPRLLWDRRGRLGLRPRPASLIDMLWLQFADEVSGKVVYRACLSCGRWVRVGPDAARTSRLYCSNACRMRGLRQRQQMARVLHSEGKSIEAIAEELDSDVPTVTRWVAGGQEGVE